MKKLHPIPSFLKFQRIDKRISELQDELVKIKNLCPPDAYTLVLYKNLGDIFYTIGMKDEFLKVYGSELHFIVRPQHEFLMKIWGVKNYVIYDLDRLVKKNSYLKLYCFGREELNFDEYDWLENTTFQTVFSCVPIKGSPFVCETQLNHFFRYPRYWCYRWAGNLGIYETFRFPIPKGSLSLSLRAQEFCDNNGGINKIVLIAPDAQTAAELPRDFWQIIVDEVLKSGYTVVVNSRKFSFKNTISAFDTNLTLEDIVAIGLNCAYVFSLRSGLCDVLIGAGERLYSFTPAILKREEGSLTIPFNNETKCNEIQLSNWSITPFKWNNIDFTSRIQKIIGKYHNKFIILNIKSKLYNRRHHRFLRNNLNDIFGYSGFFPENNAENFESFRKEPIRWMGVKIGYRTDRFEKGEHIRERSYLGGVVTTARKRGNYKIKLLTMRVFSCKRNKNNIIKLLGIPIYIKSRKDEFFEYIKRQIKPGHDHIYIIRHNIGETILYLSYFAAWARKNKSKRPLVIIWRAKDICLYRMFLDKDLCQYIEISQSDLDLFFRTDSLEIDDMTVFTPTYRIAENLKVLYNKDNKVNFNNYIKCSMRIEDVENITNIPKFDSGLVDLVRNQISYWEIKEKEFVILCPEATSLKEIPIHVWNKIIDLIHINGFKVIINASEKYSDIFDKADQVSLLPLDELYVMAMYSKSVISMASGLGVFLSTVGIPITLIYTDFKSEKIGYDSQLAIKIYSVKHLNFIKSNLVMEIDYCSLNKETFFDRISQFLSAPLIPEHFL